MSEAKSDDRYGADTAPAPPGAAPSARPESVPPKPGDPFGIVGTTQAGAYRVEEVVAEGGFGVVYRAQHGHFRAPVALKCLKVPGTLDADQRQVFLEKFRNEAELLFRLSASIPEVVRPLHVDELKLKDGRFVPFIALEWLDGQSLSTIIGRRRRAGKPPIALPKLVALLQPIAVAMARAHTFPGPSGQMAIIHRDIKPENIFIETRAGRELVRILDYGIAKARAAAATSAGRTTQDDVNVFTPAYAAPEQWVPLRFGQTGPFTDVYGLALTMVEALVGHPPIEGEMHTMFAMAIDEESRPTPRAYGVLLSDEIEAAFTRALAVDPRARSQSVPAFWSDLERAIGTTPTFAGASPSSPATKVFSSLPPRSAPVRRGEGVSSLETPLPSSGPPPKPPSLDPPPPLISSKPPPDGFAPGEIVRDNDPFAIEIDDGRSPSVRPRTPSGRPRIRDNDPGAIIRDNDPGVYQIQLDLGTSGAPYSTGRPPAPRRRSSSYERFALAQTPDPSSWPEIRAKLAGPTKLLVFAALITVVDIAAVRLYGTALAYGPVRASWIAAPIAVYAVFTGLWRFFSD